MPAPVARFRRVLTCAVLLALALAGTAAAGNGGLAPPAPASPDEAHIRSIYWLVLAITGAIFFLVEVTLVVFVVRYRSRGRARDVDGPQIRGHTNLELAWTAGPVVILAVIAAFVFWKIAGLNGPGVSAATKAPTIRIEGHQFYWEFRYPNGKIAIDALRLPYNQVSHFDIVSADVNHSWWVPALGGKVDAIPGRTNHDTWLPTKLGTYHGQCAEFCGLLHAGMLATVQIVPPDQFRSWLQSRTAQDVGHDTFVGVCAKCHGLSGQGLIGPAIATDPLLADRKALTILLRNGRNQMPAVGSDWSTQQLNATIDYLQQHFKVKAGGSGGG
jgi:cytochrome c oxidase subunit 2